MTSPTFTIGHRYRGSVDVSHLDLYRFSGFRPPSGAISSPTSTTRWSSSSGRRRARRASARARRVALEHAGGDDRVVEVAADERALLEGIA